MIGRESGARIFIQSQGRKAKVTCKQVKGYIMLADSRVAKTKLFVERFYCMTTPPFRLISKIVYVFSVVEYGTNPTRVFNSGAPRARRAEHHG